MPIKPAKFQLVWLLFGVLSTILCSASGCNTTLVIKEGSGRIPIPANSSYCFWKIELSKEPTRNSMFELSFREDFSSQDCSQYVEIWDNVWFKDPKHSIGRFGCENATRLGHILLTGKRALIEYSSSKNGSNEQKVFRYSRICVIYEDRDHDDDKGLAFTTTAVGIVLSLVFLIGFLAGGKWLVQHLMPKRRHRQRRQPRVQAPTATGLSKLPHLPNYFENDFADLPPPYLETTGADGNPVPNPKYYDNPPPYSILDTENTLETTGDTRTSDLMNRSQR